MIVPIRCHTCGKLDGDKYDDFIRELREMNGTNSTEPICFDGKKEIPETNESKLLKKRQITRYCCRIIYLTHVDLIEKV